MKKSEAIQERLLNQDEAALQAKRWRLKSKTIAFTNGVFDILHPGHLDLLAKAATFADILVVGINSDASVKRLKGQDRPVNDEAFRANLIASLIMVDAVVIFEEDTPRETINKIKPNVLIKGADYTIDTAIGGKEVIGWGGTVELLPLIEGYSTTSTIARIQNQGRR